MSGNNPFAQWGWPYPPTEREKPFSPTSIYGALPSGPSTPVPYNVPSGYASPTAALAASNPQFMSFQFVSPTNTVLNSSVLGPQGRKYFTIATHGVGNTVLINEQPGASSNGEAGGRIEWQRHPLVVLMDLVAKQTVSQWMTLSSDRRYRTMTVRGREYSWVPTAGMICLYTAGHNPSEFVARIVKGKEGTGVMVALDITAKAVQAGLLDVCVLAAVLFNSGRNID